MSSSYYYYFEESQVFGHTDDVQLDNRQLNLCLVQPICQTRPVGGLNLVFSPTFVQSNHVSSKTIRGCFIKFTNCQIGGNEKWMNHQMDELSNGWSLKLGSRGGWIVKWMKCKMDEVSNGIKCQIGVTVKYPGMEIHVSLCRHNSLHSTSVCRLGRAALTYDR